MQRKFSIAGAFSIVIVLLVMFSCNNDRKLPEKDGGNLKFDTTEAAKSVIPIDQAIRFQQSFISTRSELGRLINDSGFLSRNFNLPNGEAFSKDALLLLLSQPEATGVRVYYGKDSMGIVRLVLLPVRKDGSVIYNKLIGAGSSPADSSKANVMANSAEAVETGQTCPPCLIDFQDQ